MSSPSANGGAINAPRGLSSGEIAALSIAYFNPAAALSAVPAFVMIVAGTGAWLSFAVATFAMLCVAHAVVVFARRYVVSGSLYSYVGQVLGPTCAFVAGYGMLIGYGLLSIVVLAGFGSFVGSFLLSVGIEAGVDFRIQAPLYVVVIGLVAWLTSKGLEASAKLTLLVQAVTLPALALVVCATLFKSGFQIGLLLPPEGSTFSGLTSGVALAVTALLGFEASTALAAESKDPLKTVPRIVYGIVLGLGGLYVLMAMTQVPVLLGAGEALAAGTSPIAVLAQSAGLGFLTAPLDLLLAGSMFAALVSIFTSLARIVATMAREGMLPRWLGAVDPDNHTPTVAIRTIAVAIFFPPALTLALTGMVPMTLYVLYAPLAAFGSLLAYAMVCVAAIVLSFREKRGRALAVSTGLVGTVVAGWVVIDSMLNPAAPPANLMPYLFIGLVVAGLAAFLITRGRRDRNISTAA